MITFFLRMIEEEYEKEKEGEQKARKGDRSFDLSMDERGMRVV